MSPYYRRVTNDWAEIRTVDTDGISTTMPMNVASQDMYGASTTTRPSDTTYTFDPDQATLQTIYDSGGVDTVQAQLTDWTLGAGFENLDMLDHPSGSGHNGTGNALANTISGSNGDNVNFLTILFDRRQYRCCSKVIVPKVMVHRLKVPDVLSRPGV